MKPFPESLLNPKSATLSGEVGEASISIPLEPFTIGEESIDDAKIIADLIALPSHDFSELAGTICEFPINPADGYIVASVYIEHSHHPVDITKLVFGILSDGYIEVEAHATFVFSFEGLYLDIEDNDSKGYADCHKVLRFPMRKED